MDENAKIATMTMLGDESSLRCTTLSYRIIVNEDAHGKVLN
jgi:hypothetical protein